MKIRKALPADIEGCVVLSRIPELSTLYKATPATAKKYLLEYCRKGILIVAEDNRKIIGFISAEFMLGNFLWVDALVVKEEYRRKGIGQKLFWALKQEAQRKDIHHLYLMAPKKNKQTITFYQSSGLDKGQEFMEFSKKL